MIARHLANGFDGIKRQQRQLQRMGYKNTLPYATPMSTEKQKDTRVQCGSQVSRRRLESIKGLVGYHSFTTIMNGAYYVRIIKTILLSMPKINLIDAGDYNRIMIQNIKVG
ncbi:unnamed protein product [Rotaria socialis]|uniref:Uncharacterized protein n=1 Tax=Rotaria socialis TaxID=392032 RepID=A0A818E7C3_9BILA|nr:unnamed protein product [Rotaria socialis]